MSQHTVEDYRERLLATLIYMESATSKKTEVIPIWIVANQQNSRTNKREFKHDSEYYYECFVAEGSWNWENKGFNASSSFYFSAGFLVLNGFSFEVGRAFDC